MVGGDARGWCNDKKMYDKKMLLLVCCGQVCSSFLSLLDAAGSIQAQRRVTEILGIDISVVHISAVPFFFNGWG